MENAHKLPEIYGSMVFGDEVMRARLPREVYRSLKRTMDTGGELDRSIADTVASAMKDWAIGLGATHYTHWFQPLTGVTAEKHEAFISPLGDGKIIMEFSGKELIKGEPDASSFPSGGLRATFEARGYTAWDPASPAFVKDGTLYIPTAFCSYTGEALDTKTPLLRSMDVVSAAAVRVLRLFGDDSVRRVTATVGAEQEYFLVDKAVYDRRRDLFFTGRTLFGAPAPKGQELEDHYFGALKPRVCAFMADLDEALWRLGIDAKTKHNEAAPAQHELAPIYATANIAIDQNLLVMEYMKRTAAKHGMVCLLHEKPFAGVNGSGKHNNWSLSTDTGRNLFSPGKTPGDNKQFLLFLAAVMRAVDDYQDLLRLSVASAGNDHRLGGYEAPPAILSMFIGDELEAVIDATVHGKHFGGADRVKLNLGVPSVPTFTKDTTDRNRTSPFAFTGNKFEFRMPGSSMNIAMADIVLNTAVADALTDFARELEGAECFESTLDALLARVFSEHRRIIFNGNGYSEEWRKEAARRGLLNLPSSVEAYARLADEKNIRLFRTYGVMNETELRSRLEILLENYSKIINIEARTMLDMVRRDYLPATEAYLLRLAETANAKAKAIPGIGLRVEHELLKRITLLNEEAYDAMHALEEAETFCAAITDMHERAAAYRERVVPAMAALREKIDAIEPLVEKSLWPVPGYDELLFGVQ